MNITEKNINALKQRLETDKNKILANLASFKIQDPYSNPDRLNDNAASDTDASEESSHERIQALISELQLNLEEIENALSRISQGDYGKCINCHKVIEAERLLIKPTAVYCVNCERSLEK